jgi:hypothetical protein
MTPVKFRVARPTDDLAALRAFYVEGLGLLERGTFRGHEGYDGLLVGAPEAAWEIEFTRHEAGSACPAPSRDNLLVFYLADGAAVAAVQARLRARGLEPVAPANPYWAAKGPTYEDPDGWRVVLFNVQTLAAPSTR